MSKIINLTPHVLTFMDGANNVVLAVPSSGIARAAQTRVHVRDVDVGGVSLPVCRSTYGAVEGLPEAQDGVIYIVSALTAQACPDRADVYITDDPVRDEAGRIIGCRGIAHL